MKIELIEAYLDGVGKFKKFSVQFKDKVTWLFGPNGSGKTTVGFYGLWACIEGIVEKGCKGLIASREQILSGKSGDYRYTFNILDTNKKFTVQNHVTKSGNKIVINPEEGCDIDDSILSDLFNPALMSAKYFSALSSKEQALKLGINVAEYDDEIKRLKSEYTILNANYNAIRPVECEKVEIVNIGDLEATEKLIRKKLNDEHLDIKRNNEQKRTCYAQAKAVHQKVVDDIIESNAQASSTIKDACELLDQLKVLGYTGNEVNDFIESLPNQGDFPDFNTPEPYFQEELPDDSALVEIQSQIRSAITTNAKSINYQKYIDDTAEKERALKLVDNNRLALVDTQAKRKDYIASFDFGFDGLSANDRGELTLNGREIREPHYSNSELEIIVAQLYASTNPDFKFRFIDEFGKFDPQNQKYIVDTLTEKGFQLIISLPGDEIGDKVNNSVVLREGAIATDKPEQPKLF